MALLVLDGSQGEGGGQILRSALALSLLTGTPFRIDNIRAGRARPGLMRQHLTAVQAAGAIGGADVSEAAVGARSLFFRPARVTPGDYSFSVGTAGSTTLVLQTVLPALLTANGPSTLVLEGGTHNPMSPPFEFLARAFLPLIGRMGPQVRAVLERPGFYPAGGGRLRVEITPSPLLAPLAMEQRGAITTRRARAVVSNLPRAIAEREIARMARRLDWPSTAFGIDEVTSAGPGNIVIIELEAETLTEVMVGFGEKGVRAEAVADSAVDQVRPYLASDVPVGTHLADQLVLPLALAGDGHFRTLPPTQHTLTQLEVIPRFLDVHPRLTEQPDGSWRFEVK